MGMCFRVFQRNTEIKDMRIKNESFFRYLEILYLVMFFGIKYMFTVSSEPFAEMYIVGVAAKTFTIVRSQFDRTFFNFLQYSLIGKNHFSVLFLIVNLQGAK